MYNGKKFKGQISHLELKRDSAEKNLKGKIFKCDSFKRMPNYTFVQ
jgi:hypothetical protein